jgi:hypothetical protein
MDRGIAGAFSTVTTTEAIGYVSGGLFLCAAAAVLVLSLRRKRKTPEELEALRRGWLAANGKLGGGEIVEVEDDRLSYMYDVRGMTYNTSQDVSALQDRLPEDRWSIVGAVGVKYDARNPANSIVISEAWTGLRQKPVRKNTDAENTPDAKTDSKTDSKKGAVRLPRDERP